nr:hypothetical protein [uncultured Brumimicrobium sp.]
MKLSQLHDLNIESFYFFILVFFLLPLNWGIELLKWQRILKVNKIYIVSNTLIQSLFSGVTTGIITPNRIGNFIGRMLFFKGKIRGQLILGTLYSNFAQFLSTITFGAISIIWFHEVLFSTYGELATYISCIILLIGLTFYFVIPYVSLPSLKFLNKKENLLKHFQVNARQLVFPLFYLSSLRYLIFSFQFLLMLMAFGEPFSLLLLAGVFFTYLVSTLIPSFVFGKLLIRETSGLVILSFVVENEMVIIVSSLLLWLINLGIPSLIGMFFIFRKKFLLNA